MKIKFSEYTQAHSTGERPALKAQLAVTNKKVTFTFYKNALRVSIKTTEVLKLEQYKENKLRSYALSLTHVNFSL